ncbi:CatB-related O-acetyltransferase [Chryseobacterium sp. RG1]|uniref:CatB-related O-acetyltransferase n=1 Tax=Chryseobacterium tagetis TaxID=2801334 RepID=A0ABS8A843_9FLAO|nr:CatB-related O-acetyltransferase [Chryseobacterium tagetis]MCA6069105.1 CatB-related O-acetyltransferase [Chryseobacterium tagetis]
MKKLYKIIIYYCNDILNDLKQTGNVANWRLKNKHNKTIIKKSVKNANLITVGNHSYGILDVLTFGNPAEKLVIGSYVSIAENVTFILGGNHQINSFSTYPLQAFFFENTNFDDTQTKGPIIIEDEVWIGSNVLILSGVTVGKGSIVAAGSVVTKNIEPFTIVGGNPAKFIKYRIPKELIDERLKVDIQNIPFELLSRTELDVFYNSLTSESLDKIKNLIVSKEQNDN